MYHMVYGFLFIVALLGPWVACPLADRLSNLRANNGRGMRVMLVIIMLLAAVFYSLLMCIPTVTRFDSDHKPAVSFICGPEGALLHHERCNDPACHSWDTDEVSHLPYISIRTWFFFCQVKQCSQCKLWSCSQILNCEGHACISKLNNAHRSRWIKEYHFFKSLGLQWVCLFLSQLPDLLTSGGLKHHNFNSSSIDMFSSWQKTKH